MKALGLHDLAGRSLRDTQIGKNGVHNFVGLLHHSTFGRLADILMSTMRTGFPMIR